MRGELELGAASAGPLMHAGMSQLVEDQKVALLRQGGQQSEVGNVAAAEEQRAFSSEEHRRLRLQGLMLRRIAAQ